MALVLVGSKSHNVFKAYFERRVAQGMPNMRALGHLCGKVSHVIFAMLRDAVHYDARSHAAAVGVEWDDRFSRRSRSADPS